MPELEARMRLRPLAESLATYFQTLDDSLSKLSEGKEGYLPGLPQWCLSRRRITLACSRDGEGVVLRVKADPSLQADEIEFHEIRDRAHLNELSAPWTANYEPHQLKRSPFMMMFGFSMGEDDPLAMPSKDPDLSGWGRMQGVEAEFTVEKATAEAIAFWNTALIGAKDGQSFPEAVEAALSRLSSMIHQKAFRERRLHRLLRDHGDRLLPHASGIFFEHSLEQEDGTTRVADFILKREEGLPALLVELEAPVHKILTKKGELTKEAQHARHQIGEWVAAIDRVPHKNAVGPMAFLSGPKARLVVIGRGLDQKERLLQERFNDTVFWTWDMLLQAARERWNRTIADQYRALGRDPVKLF